MYAIFTNEKLNKIHCLKKTNVIILICTTCYSFELGAINIIQKFYQ